MKNNYKTEFEKLSKSFTINQKEIEKLTQQIQTQKRLFQIFVALIIGIVSIVLYNNISNTKKRLQLKDEEIDRMKKETYFVNLLYGARAGTPKTLYTNDEEKINLIISVANESLFEDISSCYKTNPEFDLYRTCFRDLSIELHNKLEFKFGPHWIVTTGKVATCFMVTTMSSEHEEYFFRFADIYFEVFKYRNEVINKKIEEYFQDSENTEKTNHSNVENMIIEKLNEEVLENNLEGEKTKDGSENDSIEELRKVEKAEPKVN